MENPGWVRRKPGPAWKKNFNGFYAVAGDMYPKYGAVSSRFPAKTAGFFCIRQKFAAFSGPWGGAIARARLRNGWNRSDSGKTWGMA
jgi:hypothetical protein